MKKKSNFKFLLEVSGKEKYKLYFSAISSVISSILAIIPFILMYNIILELFKESMDIDRIKYLVFTTIIVVIFRFVFFTASGIFSHIAAFTILYELRMRTIEHISKLTMGFFTTHATGELKKIINEDIEKLENFIAHQIPDLASAAITPILVLGYLMFLNWKLSLILFIPIVLAILVQARAFAGYEERMSHYHGLLSKLNSTIIQYIHGMPVMKAFNLSAKSFEQYKKVNDEYVDYWEYISKKTSPPYSIFLVIIDTGLLFMIPFGGIFYLNGSVDLSTYILFLILSMTFLSSFKQLIEFGATFSFLLEGAGKVREILEMPVLASGTKRISEELKEGIEFRDVDFRYDEKEIFKGLNMKINKNTTVALVGPSGGGKTTMAQLIGRFWDIERGKILIDGIDIKEISVESLMDNISFVFQDVFMLHDTILENIKMGRDIPIERVVKAAKEAEIHDFIMALPHKYNTKLGEHGIKLSGGEKQRISIARAILKDSPIVLLDEVTSYSDIENESKIQEALERLLKGKTVVIIAHRLYTIKNADNIVVIEDGKIVEEGTHKKLMENKGLYKHLWDMYEYDGEYIEKSGEIYV